MPSKEFAYKQYTEEKPEENRRTFKVTEKQEGIDVEDGSKKEPGVTEAKGQKKCVIFLIGAIRIVNIMQVFL